MTSKRFDLASLSILETRDGIAFNESVVANGFAEVDGAGERWNNMRPALTSGLAGTLSGQGLVILPTPTSPLFGVVGGTGGAFIGTWGSASSFFLGTSTNVPGFLAALDPFLFKIDFENQIVYRSPLGTNLTFSTLGTTTQFSENSRVDLTQTDDYMVAGVGFSGVYEYVASQDGFSWEPVDGGFSVRVGNIVGLGAGVYRFSGNGFTLMDTDGGYSYYTKGTSTSGWDVTVGTQASSFGTFKMFTTSLSTANGRVWAVGTATWTGGTSVLVLEGNDSGGVFTWDLIGTLASSNYGIDFQKRFAWHQGSQRTAFPMGSAGGPIITITPAGVFGTTSSIPDKSALSGGSLMFSFSTSRVSRFNLANSGGFTP